MYPIKFRLSDNHFSEIEINDFFFLFSYLMLKNVITYASFGCKTTFFLWIKIHYVDHKCQKKKVKQRYGQKRYRFFGQINMSFDINYCSDEL
jgi:hypothetical protein